MAKKFTEKQKEILARKLGYDGPMNMFDQFMKSDLAMERKYNAVLDKFMARGGVVKQKFAAGGAAFDPNTYDVSSGIGMNKYNELVSMGASKQQIIDIAKRAGVIGTRIKEVIPELAQIDTWGLDQPVDTSVVPAGFNYQTYIQANPDLQAAGIDTAAEARRHYALYGMNEGRAGVTGAAAPAALPSVNLPTTITEPTTTAPTATAPTAQTAKIGEATQDQLVQAPTPVAPTTIETAKTVPATVAPTPTAGTAATIEAAKSQGQVATAVEGNKAITGTLSQSAIATAAEKDPAETALKNIEAAKIQNPVEVAGVPARTLQAEELVSGPAVNMAQVEAAINKAEAATASVKPEMTVQGQLDKLLTDFDSGNPPAWAASSLRNANAVLSARGLGASSLAGQAVIQATLEAAIPIAAQDAQTVATLELQNLSNRQQVAILAAQQRAAFLGQSFDQEFQAKVLNAAKVADIANLNFTAEQTIALENARLAQTVDLANLTNEQAVIMAKAAQVANLESANLNNRQQAALQNAQAFLQLDLTNLNNEQQTALFNAEKVIQSIFTDTAAENAAKQFNATSEMQVQQFYDSLATQVNQFNVSQINAVNQFNAGQENAVAQFNAQIINAADQFNAQNRLVVDQSNAEWRRQIATIDTAAQNTVNQFNVQSELQITLSELNNQWQVYRDNMEYAFTAAQNALDRENKLALQVLANEATIMAADKQVDASMWEAGGMLTAAVAAPLVKSWVTPTGGGGGGGGGGSVIDYSVSDWSATFGTDSLSSSGISYDDVDSYIEYGAGL